MGTGRTEEVDDAFVDGLNEHQQVLDEHPKRHDGTRIGKIVFIKLVTPTGSAKPCYKKKKRTSNAPCIG